MKLTVLILCLFCSAVFAKDPPPLALIKNISEQTLNELQKHNKGKLQDKEAIHNIIKRIIMPHFDVTILSRSITGNDYWRSSSASERSQYIEKFSNYVTSMYAWILSAYKDETISFKPMMKFDPAQSRAQVNSIVKKPGGKSINLDYRLIRQGTTWKIYDVSIGGVSMIKNYRAQLGGRLAQVNKPFRIYNERG
jgi:phospholipid transport system substrate-binding protein